ncbi:hypothetical protein D3C85_1449840 [compost metagenome]
MALRKPTNCVSVTETPASGTIATRVAPARKRLDSPATTTSDEHTSPMPPPPAAKPCTAQTTGALRRMSSDTTNCR